MRRFILLAVATLSWAVVVSAKEYQSSFGFTFDAPDAWLVMTRAELTVNPVFANANPAIRAKVEAGLVEILYDRATSDATFTDYVDIKLGIKGGIPNSPDEVKTECTRYGQALAKAAGKALAVTTCEDRDLGTAKAFYVEYAGSVAGTVTLQYQLVRTDGKLVYITAVCKESSLAQVRPEFEAIVRSIRFS